VNGSRDAFTASPGKRGRSDRNAAGRLRGRRREALHEGLLLGRAVGAGVGF